MNQAAQKVWKLPELTWNIGENLRPPHLLICVQVCRQWNEIFIPLLWRVIDDTKYAWPTLLKSLAKQYPDHDSDCLERQTNTPNTNSRIWIEDVFVKYGRHIRHLTISHTFLNNAAAKSGTCTHLQSLWLLSLWDTRTIRVDHLSLPSNNNAATTAWETVSESTGLVSLILEGIVDPGFPRSGHRAKLDWICAQWFWVLVLQNQGLVTLQLSWKLQSKSPLFSTSFLTRVYQRLSKSLRQLSVHLPNMAIPAVLDVLPNVDTIYWKHTDLYSHGSTTSQPLCNTTVFPQVRTAIVGERIKASNVYDLLRTFPNLQQLCLWTPIDFSENWTLQQAKDHLSNNSPFHPLSGLHFVNVFPPGARMDQLATHIIPFLPHLTEVTLNSLDTAVATALAIHCPGLEKFAQIWDGGSLHSNHDLRFEVNAMGILLERCPNLKIFDGIQHKIEADYLAEHPWACRRIEYLRCQIVGLGRLTSDEEAIFKGNSQEVDVRRREETKEKHRRCQEQHQKVYAQLSTLVHLRALYLGFEYIECWLEPLDPTTRFTIGGRLYYAGNGPIPNTLELSLESGLDRLSTLRRLEVLDFEGVDHRINEAELEWMVNNLPSIRVVGGLEEFTVFEGYEDPRVNDLKEYLSRLKPWIRQEVVDRKSAPERCLQRYFYSLPLPTEL
ncbi:hypothetical protein KI688_005240 [Linnemannia hyalina]|uniref:F-box domain-containing protein n=1 Tax=Linnemannia hyalina TaxID=64524 RepID=A0A9P7XMP1_9FUNG|nr:hypothetical protein KI688_005240 [Linnemannia hyalina]